MRPRVHFALFLCLSLLAQAFQAAALFSAPLDQSVAARLCVDDGHDDPARDDSRQRCDHCLLCQPTSDQPYLLEPARGYEASELRPHVLAACPDSDPDVPERPLDSHRARAPPA